MRCDGLTLGLPIRRERKAKREDNVRRCPPVGVVERLGAIVMKNVRQNQELDWDMSRVRPVRLG